MTEKPQLPKTVNFSSEQEARNFVCNKKNEGYNNRDLLKTHITVNGKKYPLNISKINNLYKEPENITHRNISDADFVRIFQKGLGPNSAVMQLGCTFGEADKAYCNFLKHADMVTITYSEHKKLFELASEVDPSANTMPRVISALETTTESHVEFEQYKYPCVDCGKLIRISVGEWQDLKEFMMNNRFGHHDCNNP